MVALSKEGLRGKGRAKIVSGWNNNEKALAISLLAIKTQTIPRSPQRRGSQTRQAKARQARRLGSWWGSAR
jgi:hypothetical protein